MWGLVLGALLMQVFQCYCMKKSSLLLEGVQGTICFTAWRYSLCTLLALGMALMSSKLPYCSLQTLSIAALGGISLALCGVCGLLAMQEDAVVLVNMASTAGILLPCAAGAWLFEEKIGWNHGAGLALFLTAAWLLMGYSVSVKGKVSGKTRFLLLLVFAANGFTMVAQKLFACYGRESVSVFSFYMFAFAAVLLFLFSLIKKKDTGRFLPAKREGVYLVILSVAVFVINQAMTSASSAISSVVLFPVFNGSSLMLTTLMSALVFREKLTVKSVMGLLCGIAALVFLNM